jgi:DNA-binding FadR family transcriptional regulator
MQPLNEPLRQTPALSRSDEIAAVLRDEILRGQYRAGERLPSERDLAIRFATGRGPVREALKKLDQLGIASIQRGGARVVAIEHCTLDVLGPLLDLEDVPDPELVDQVLEIIGVLMRVAAVDALRKSKASEIEQAKKLMTRMLDIDSDQAERHEALRELTEFFIDVADHLILRLIMNGLRTNFMGRMHKLGFPLELDGASFREIAMELRTALDNRDPQQVGDAMLRLNRFFRDGARQALVTRSANAERISA